MPWVKNLHSYLTVIFGVIAGYRIYLKKAMDIFD